jgi:hypothetical protein
MKLETSEDTLTIALEGWERVWALRRRVIVPRARIVHAEWHSEPFQIHASLRLAGTGFPGVIAAGTFYGQGMKQFLYLRRPQVWARKTIENVLVLDLHDMFYHRIVLSCPQAEAARVIAWVKATA